MGTCQSCGGPCATFKGSVWQWTCQACIRLAMDARAARADAADRKARERLVRNLKTHSPVRTAPKGGGSDSYVPHRPSVLATHP